MWAKFWIIKKGLVQFREENGEFALGELNLCVLCHHYSEAFRCGEIRFKSLKLQVTTCEFLVEFYAIPLYFTSIKLEYLNRH